MRPSFRRESRATKDSSLGQSIPFQTATIVARQSPSAEGTTSLPQQRAPHLCPTASDQVAEAHHLSVSLLSTLVQRRFHERGVIVATELLDDDLTRSVSNGCPEQT